MKREQWLSTHKELAKKVVYQNTVDIVMDLMKQLNRKRDYSGGYYQTKVGIIRLQFNGHWEWELIKIKEV